MIKNVNKNLTGLIHINQHSYQQYSSDIPIIILMQNIPYQSTKMSRLERISSLRTSMKHISLLSKKTIQLEGKFNSKMDSQEHMEKFSKTEDSTSNESDSFLRRQHSQTGVFHQKYELLEKIGQGANGCVYRCRHKKSGKIYAAKKLKIQQECILELKRNFINLKELHHSSIIKYRALYVDISHHCAFLVMECFDMPNLSQCFINNQNQLKMIVKQLVNALQYLHHKNICHRDIKPENILYCTKTKEIKIIDFGISKKTFQKGTRRDMLTIIGTQFYQAPEMYIGGGYDQRVDLWALGVTIFKLITGETPFQSQYHSATIKKITKAEVKYDHQSWNRYSTFSKDFVSRLLKQKCERMSIKDAINHIWLSETTKLQRSISQLVVLHEEFHDEIQNKMKNALSREEGAKLTRKLRSRKIDLINKTQFDLSDSEEDLDEKTPSETQENFIII